jgi:uncharacterized membrane protein
MRPGKVETPGAGTRISGRSISVWRMDYRFTPFAPVAPNAKGTSTSCADATRLATGTRFHGSGFSNHSRMTAICPINSRRRPMHNFIFRRLAQLRQNYWFWPSMMTFVAVVLGIAVPLVDAWLGSEWTRSLGWLRATQVEGARAILTTLAAATLGVAGVAFSVTIVAVSFASSNYGPRLIGNFMGDRTNQIVLGVFVATFVYCITVLSTVHGQLDLSDTTREAFVPQLSVYLALLLTLAAVGALIGYIHHIPESINIMNLTAQIGDKLQRLVIRMLEEDDRPAPEDSDPAGSEAWNPTPPSEGAVLVRATNAGYLQQVDFESLVDLARETRAQITLHRTPGEFLVAGEPIMSMRCRSDSDSDSDSDGSIAHRMRDCYTQGANRTDIQDVLFLSDQLVEVLGRALSPGVNDPHTAMLCLDWLRAGLAEFARRPPPRPARHDEPVLYRRVTFEDMMNRSFDRMRQYVAGDRTVTLHALEMLAYLARIAARPAMANACEQQMRRLTTSAVELLTESAARGEIETASAAALKATASNCTRPEHA